MIRWLKDILGRWQTKHIRTETIRDNYRIITQNQAALEQGGML